MVMPVADMILAPGFELLARQLLTNCLERGITMVPYDTLRTPFKQAHYWKRGKTKEVLDEAMHLLKSNNAFFLMHCLEVASTRRTELVTHALPGCSWHQWGEAMDCYWLNEGEPVWDLNTCNNSGLNGYSVYAEEAGKLGLQAGFYWTHLVDAVHVQLRPEHSPLNLYTLTEIDQVMKDAFA